MIEQLAGGQLGQIQDLKMQIQEGIKTGAQKIDQNFGVGGVRSSVDVQKSGGLQGVGAPSFDNVLSAVNSGTDAAIKGKENAVMNAMTGSGSIHEASMQMKSSGLHLKFMAQVYKTGTSGLQELMRMSV